MNYVSAEVKPACRISTARRKKVRVRQLILFVMAIIPVILLIAVLASAFSSTEAYTIAYELGMSALNIADKGDGKIPDADRNRLLGDITVNEEEQKTEEKTETALPYTDREVELIAKTIYGEALVTNSDMEMAAVAWCILNRVDTPGFPNTIEGVVTARRQFHGYSESHPVTEHIEWLVRDVLDRWYAEKAGVTDSGRVLPKDCVYFEGNGHHNWFTNEWLSDDFYDWSLPNPYKN